MFPRTFHLSGFKYIDFCLCDRSTQVTMNCVRLYNNIFIQIYHDVIMAQSRVDIGRGTKIFWLLGLTGSVSQKVVSFLHSYFSTSVS